MKIKNIFKYTLSILLVLASINSYSQFNKFTVVLDAGHGGKDPGNSYHGFSEKQISLKTTLKVGEFLEKDKDIVVIYTRKTDVFIELKERPHIANKENAHLFVSIHCNSVKNFGPVGTETFVMGLSRTNTNMEVAKKENSVILLEDNYKQKYAGFDPSKPESLMGLKILQEENLNNSINLAAKIQDNFTNSLDRKSRGVKQQPLWVLDASTMPGVLIELGFLSNIEEGTFLNSEEGQEKMAREIANAIFIYKKEFFGESSEPIFNKPERIVVDKKDTIKVVKIDNPIANPNNVIQLGTIFKVQLSASSKRLDLVPKNFKGLKNITSSFSNGVYKYMYGATSNYNEAQNMLQEAKSKGYTTSYLVAFKDGKSINIQDAIK